MPTPSTFYTVDGLIQSTDDTDSVGYEMDAAWGGESVFKDGAWHYLPGHARAPVAHISPADILAYDLRQIGPDAQDRINAASMSIAQNKDGDYLPFRLDTQVLEDARLVDGTPYEADLGTRGFITDSVHARQALSIALRRTRYPTLTALRISPGAKLERLAIHPGDIVTYTDARYGVYGERNRVMSSTVHPDLSMTLSLRGEPVTTYDPALPYLPPAGPTEPLWRRLFKHPSQTNLLGASSEHIAVDGNTILLGIDRTAEDGYLAAYYSTAGEKLGDAFEETRVRWVRGMTLWRDGEDLEPVWLHANVSNSWMREGSDGTISNRSSQRFFNTMAIRRGPSAPSSGRTRGFVITQRGGRSTPAFYLVTVNFNLFKPLGQSLTAGGFTLGAASTITGNAVSAANCVVERLDGSLLSSFIDLGDGFRVVSSAGATSSEAAFTFQGQGDERALNQLHGFCVAPDGRLYANASVALGDADFQDYIYVRRNATEPDEDRGQ